MCTCASTTTDTTLYSCGQTSRRKELLSTLNSHTTRILGAFFFKRAHLSLSSRKKASVGPGVKMRTYKKSREGLHVDTRFRLVASGSVSPQRMSSFHVIVAELHIATIGHVPMYQASKAPCQLCRFSAIRVPAVAGCRVFVDRVDVQVPDFSTLLNPIVLKKWPRQPRWL